MAQANPATILSLLAIADAAKFMLAADDTAGWEVSDYTREVQALSAALKECTHGQ